METTTASFTPVKATIENKSSKALRDRGTLSRQDFDGGPISLDEIEPGLFLGNLTAATHMETLKTFQITHILTLDSVPLPQHITEASFLTTKYVHVADVIKADILHHLEDCIEFINEALQKSRKILVHCYYGVSRSSSAIIAYIMKQHDMDYQKAYELVKSKRRFVQPNAGFVAQLKLFRRMGCQIDTNFPKFKIYCLRLAGEQMQKAKILPQNFNHLIKPDPAITQENPEPIVYRCRKCRRVLASKSHLLQHHYKSLSASAPEFEGSSDNIVLNTSAKEQHNSQPRLLEQIAEQIRKVSIDSTVTRNAGPEQTDKGDTVCRNIIFVEPIGWMKSVINNPQGRLNCPKCDQKVGNFSWINGCQCPCGEEIMPAFYLIPSRVELSRTVQNVQTTL